MQKSPVNSIENGPPIKDENYFQKLPLKNMKNWPHNEKNLSQKYKYAKILIGKWPKIQII